MTAGIIAAHAVQAAVGGGSVSVRTTQTSTSGSGFVADLTLANEGELMVVLIGSTSDITRPAGWTSFGGALGGAGDARASAFYKVKEAGDPTSVTFSTSATACHSAMLVLEGEHAGTADFESTGGAAGTTGPNNYPHVVTGEVGELLLTHIFARATSGTWSSDRGVEEAATSTDAGSGKVHNHRVFAEEIAARHTATTQTLSEPSGTTYAHARQIVRVPKAGGSPVYLGGSGPVWNGGTTSANVTVPATVKAGDMLLMFASAVSDVGFNINTPSGWTLLHAVTTGVSTRKASVFYKVATGAEAGTSLTFSTSASSQKIASLAAYRGVDTATAPAVASTYTATASGEAPAIATSTPSCRVLSWYYGGDFNSGSNSVTPPTADGLRTRIAASVERGTHALQDEVVWDADTKASRTATFGGVQFSGGASIVLAPAAAA